jgi:xylose isomerase
MKPTTSAPEPQFAFGAWAFMGGMDDRFGKGYNLFPLELEEVFELTAKIDGMAYVCGHFPSEFPDDPDLLARLARQYKVGIGSVVAKTFGARFKNGGFSNPDPVIRKEALDNVKRAMELNNLLRPVMGELGKPLGCMHAVLWQGNDGSNGLFLSDYARAWNLMVDGYVEVLEAVPDCRICLEPKSGDPAEDMLVRETIHGLFLARMVEENVRSRLKNEILREHPAMQAVAFFETLERKFSTLQGRIVQNIEYGHAHIAGGKLAESICLALEYGILRQIDLNDNRKHWDNDHIPGNDNFNEVLEAEYWLYWKGFDGLWNFDIWPQRVPGETKKDTIRRFALHLVECINATRYRLEIVKRLPPPEEMEQFFRDPDETNISRLLRSVMNQKLDFQESRYRG